MPSHAHQGSLRGVAARSGRLDQLVAEAFPVLSRARAAALIRSGSVQLDGQVASKPATRVVEGAVLVVDLPPPAPARAVPQDLPLALVYEDADLVVVDKAPGMVVHPGPGHPDGTLVNAMLHHVGGLSGIGGVERPGIVHRLDRGTSGLLVVAKTDLAHRHLAAQFAAHTAGRTYLAICLGAPSTASGVLRSRLARHPRDRLRWASTDGDHGKLAITHYRLLARSEGLGLVECRLETGRTHQVRVHLSEQGWPLVGDELYRRRGRRPPVPLRPLATRPMLHAWQLHLVHPTTGEELGYTAPPPEDFTTLLEAAGLPEIRDRAPGR